MSYYVLGEQLPYATEQGILDGEQGNGSTNQGSLGADQGNSAMP
jgi:hypothetical protein